MRAISGRQGACASTIALPWAVAAILAAACSSSPSGTPLAAPTAFQVRGQLTLTATGPTAISSPPNEQDFLLYVDPAAPSVVSFIQQGAVDHATATTNGVSFEVASGFTVGLPGSCGGSSVSYSSFRFSVDAMTGTLAGTASGIASLTVGDEAFSYTAALTFTGTRDLTGPTFDLPAAMDPFHPSDLSPSRPLPSSATAQLVDSGESITLAPRLSYDLLVVGFSFPAGPLPRYGTAYDVVVTPWQDLADNIGAAPGQLATRAAPLLVAREDFEDPAAASGDGTIVDDTFLPPISGLRSAVLVNGQSNSGLAFTSPHVSARLQVTPGDTVVRFAVRPFSLSASASTSGISMQVGVPGGAITSAMLPTTETITLPSDPSTIGTPGLGDVRTVEISLPAGATSEVIVDLGAKSPISCGPPRPSSAGYLIDDMRVE